MKNNPFLCRKLMAVFAAIALGHSALWTGGALRAEGNPEFVGVLATITEPSRAAELGLSDEQVSKLTELIQRYEGRALELGTLLRGLPPEERPFKQMESVRTVEKEGYLLLDEKQKGTAEQWRLQELGPIALFDPEFASKLGLTPDQLAKAQTILQGRGALIRSRGREKGESELKQRLAEVLGEEQKGKWTELAGAPLPAPVQLDNATVEQEVGEAGSPSDRVVESSPPNSPSPEGDKSGPVMTGPEDGLLLNFSGAPWPEVLKWIAKEAELNLHLDTFPTGTFSNRDPYRRYTVEEALDLMNFSLMSKGFTLVKKHRILQAIDLGSADSPEAMRSYLREIAELVPPEKLEKRGEYEILKTVFTLQRTSVEDVEREIRMLIGPQGSIVPLTSSGQLLVTEMGGNLRIIRDTIERAENPNESRSSTIDSISLEFVSAEEVLGIARGLLGIRDNEFRAEDISISTDTFGNTIFATGSVAKRQTLRDIAKKIDVKPAESATKMGAVEKPSVRSHLLFGSDPTTTLGVLQTLFAGQPNINMELDSRTNNIIVRAVPSDHEIIKETIKELAGQSSDFDIIPLGNIDTNAVVLTLEKFYGKSPTTTSSRDTTAPKGPIFYGDAAGRRLLVKGTKQEVEQIRMLITKIEDGSQVEGLDDGIRTIPVRGRSAERLLETLEILNRASRSRIKISLPKSATEKGSDTVNGEAPKPAPPPPPATEKNPSAQLEPQNSGVLVASFQEPAAAEGGDDPNSAPNSAETASSVQVTSNADASSSDGEVIQVGSGEVKIIQGPTGLIVASDDPEAMNEFDRLMRMAKDQMETAPSEPTIRFLVHIRASEAAELVKTIIAGEQASGGGSLLGDVASNMLGGGGLFGSLFGGGGGGSSSDAVSGASTVGNVTITPDPRLNAVWIQANPIDAFFVEDILDRIDVPESSVDILTRGKVQIIYLENRDVAEVEPLVKQTFATNIATQQSSGGGGGGGGGGGQQPSPQDFVNMLRSAAGGGGGGRRGGGAAGGQTQLKEQTMTITADAKNNALIVVGPNYLYEQVRALVEMMDERAAEDEQTIITIPLDGDVNPAIIQSTLSSVFGVRTTTATPTSNQPTSQQRSGNSTSPFNPGSFQRGTGGGFPFGGGQFGSGQPGGFRGGNQGGQPGGFQGTGNRGNFQGTGNRGNFQGGNRGNQGGNTSNRR